MNEVVLKLTKEEVDALWLCVHDGLRRKTTEGFGKNATIYEAQLVFYVYGKLESARAEALANENRNGI